MYVEVRTWLIPVQYNYARGEAEFLIKVSDDDKVGLMLQNISQQVKSYVLKLRRIVF